MCGRYVSVASTADMTAEFDVGEVVGADLAASWNVAPTDPVRAIVKRRRDRADPSADPDTDPVRQLRTVRWGLVPTWSTGRSGGAKMINARVETVTSKPAFRAAAGRRRCLLPAQGYFEWQNTDEGKVPYFLHGAGHRILAMAGLYELWRDRDRADDDPERWLWTCTVITRPATDLLGHIHDRTPVLVPRELHEPWLDCRSDDPATARALLEQMPEAHLEPDVVSSAVNSVRNNGPDLIRPIPAHQAPWQPRLPL